MVSLRGFRGDARTARASHRTVVGHVPGSRAAGVVVARASVAPRCVGESTNLGRPHSSSGDDAAEAGGDRQLSARPIRDVTPQWRSKTVNCRLL